MSFSSSQYSFAFAPPSLVSSSPSASASFESLTTPRHRKQLKLQLQVAVPVQQPIWNMHSAYETLAARGYHVERFMKESLYGHVLLAKRTTAVDAMTSSDLTFSSSSAASSPASTSSLVCIKISQLTFAQSLTSPCLNGRSIPVNDRVFAEAALLRAAAHNPTVVALVEEFTDATFHYLVTSYAGVELYELVSNTSSAAAGASSLASTAASIAASTAPAPAAAAAVATGGLPIEKVKHYTRQLVSGVHHLHDVSRLAHLDLSLTNVCVDEEDKLSIIDFGLGDLDVVDTNADATMSANTQMMKDELSSSLHCCQQASDSGESSTAPTAPVTPITPVRRFSSTTQSSPQINLQGLSIAISSTTPLTLSPTTISTMSSSTSSPNQQHMHMHMFSPTSIPSAINSPWQQMSDMLLPTTASASPTNTPFTSRENVTSIMSHHHPSVLSSSSSSSSSASPSFLAPLPSLRLDEFHSPSTTTTKHHHQRVASTPQVSPPATTTTAATCTNAFHWPAAAAALTTTTTTAAASTTSSASMFYTSRLRSDLPPSKLHAQSPEQRSATEYHTRCVVEMNVDDVATSPVWSPFASDIYALGVMVFEMATGEKWNWMKHEPIAREGRPASLKKPDAIDEQTWSFVQAATQPENKRPQAHQLASHAFLQ